MWYEGKEADHRIVQLRAAASGHAVAPASMLKSRLLISSPKLRIRRPRYNLALETLAQ